jgi:hypothetical protein
MTITIYREPGAPTAGATAEDGEHTVVVVRDASVSDRELVMEALDGIEDLRTEPAPLR